MQNDKYKETKDEGSIEKLEKLEKLVENRGTGSGVKLNRFSPKLKIHPPLQ